MAIEVVVKCKGYWREDKAILFEQNLSRGGK
jgi:hypothetical protein